MKKPISLILILIISIILSSCTGGNNIKTLNYEGKGNDWNFSQEFNDNGTSKIFGKYIGNGTAPKKINFNFEHLSKKTSDGNCEYSESLNGFSIVLPNDSKSEDNIKKYKNVTTLNLTIKWDNQTEVIKLQKTN